MVTGPISRTSARNGSKRRITLKCNNLRFLAKHCEPMVEVYCESMRRERADNLVQEINPVEAAGKHLAAWAPTAAGLDVVGEIEKALQDIPEGQAIAVFGCGGTLPPSLPPAVVADFDRGLLAGSVGRPDPRRGQPHRLLRPGAVPRLGALAAQP
jgi:hypothetical protein